MQTTWLDGRAKEDGRNRPSRRRRDIDGLRLRQARRKLPARTAPPHFLPMTRLEKIDLSRAADTCGDQVRLPRELCRPQHDRRLRTRQIRFERSQPPPQWTSRTSKGGRCVTLQGRSEPSVLV